MWAQWLEQYGLWIVFLGGVLEGEVVLLLAGYGVSRGYLPAPQAYFLAALGAHVGDSTYYLVGRRFGPSIIRRFPALRPLRAKAMKLVRRRGYLAAFLARFLYGMRIILPLTLGAVRVSPRTFFPANVAAAMIFAGVYLTGGYLLGEAVEHLLGRVGGYEKWIVLGLLVVGGLSWAIREWRLFHAPPPKAAPVEEDPPVEEEAEEGVSPPLP